MTRRSSITGSLAALALALLLRSQPAAACTDEPTVGSAFFPNPVPASGTTAPRNTRIWVPPRDPRADLADTDIVVKAGDAVVATTRTAIAVAGERDTIVWMITPTAPLSPGSTITVTVQGDELSRFLVGDDDDVAAPAVPIATQVRVEGAYFGGFTCPEPSSVVVTVAGNEDLLIVTTAAAVDVPAAALAIGTGPRAGATDLPEGEHSLHAVAVDLAGNTSSAPLPAFTVPAEQSGCTAGGGANGPCTIAMIAAIALRRRRGSR